MNNSKPLVVLVGGNVQSCCKVKSIYGGYNSVLATLAFSFVNIQHDSQDINVGGSDILHFR